MKNWDSAFDYMCKLPYKLSIKLYWKHIFTKKKKIGYLKFNYISEVIEIDRLQS